MLELAAIWLAAYLIGGIPFGYLVARSRGVDILKAGSGNIGATNVGRVLGIRFGILVFILDFAKGALPVAGAILTHHLHPISPDDGLLRKDWLDHGLVEVGAGLLAFVGHLLPVYLGFRGGKGVATGAGVVAVLVWQPALAALVTWVLLASAFRYVSVASIGAAMVLCVVQLSLTSCDVNDPHNWICLLAGILIVARHRSNMGRLLKGTENRLPDSAVLDFTAKALHVLALALWFGGAVFFSLVVAPTVFDTFEKIAADPDRPDVLPLPEKYAKVVGKVDGPHEQALRLSARVVGPIFPQYFLMQLFCAIIALVPAIAWAGSSPGKVQRWRRNLLAAALLLIVVSGFLGQKVRELQGSRNQAVDGYLHAPNEDTLKTMTAARGQFGMWHGVSLLVNYATILLVTGGMLLTVALPARKA